MAAPARVPPVTEVQMVIDKGRFKDVFLVVKSDPKSTNVTLDMQESRDAWRAKASYNLRRALSELKFQETGTWGLTLITTEQEVTFNFKTEPEVMAFHTFICEKSEVYAENKAISQLDDEMMKIWPFPGGSFF
jgi:hypothetical protein